MREINLSERVKKYEDDDKAIEAARNVMKRWFPGQIGRARAEIYSTLYKSG